MTGLWAIDGQSQSGHVGTRHYGDQFEAWKNGEYHYIPLDAETVEELTVSRLELTFRRRKRVISG